MHRARLLASLLCSLMLVLFRAASACGQDGEPLAGDELLKFLGPVSPDQFTWRMVNGPDFVVYRGKANPPLNGSVGFYLGGFPQDLEKSSTTIGARLGRFPVKWQRSTNADGSIDQETITVVDEVMNMKAHVWATAPSEKEIDDLLVALGQLPTFSSGALPDRFDEFRVILLEEQRIRRCIWIGWSVVLIVSAWFVDRISRRRQASGAMRLLTFSGVIAFVILATVGVAFFSPTIVIDWLNKAYVMLLFAAAGWSVYVRLYSPA